MMKNYLIPIVNSVVFTVLFLVAIIGFQNDLAGLFGISAVPKSGLSVLKDMILPIFASFGGAISGAYIAFRLQSETEKKKRLEENLSYVNRTIFTLHMQLTDLLNTKEQIILPHQENPFRFLMIYPMANDDQVCEKVSMDFAQVLIDNQKPQLVQDILIAEKQYFNLIYLFQKRNTLKEEIDALLADNGFGHGSDFRLGEVFKIIGSQRLASIYDLTEKYIDLLDGSVLYINNTIIDLMNVSGIIFKDNDKIRITFEKDDRYKMLLQPIMAPYFKSKELMFQYCNADLADIVKNNKIM
jgi:hypothetical protein